MNKKSHSLFIIFTLLLSFLGSEILYLGTTQSMSEQELDKKINFVSLTGLPDLALSNESSYLRHRSVSDIFSIYNEDASLREHDLVSFSTSNFKDLKQ